MHGQKNDANKKAPGLHTPRRVRAMAPRKPVDAPPRPRGRPSTGALRTQVRLTPADIARARLLGAGNVSAGIRLALASVAGQNPASSKFS